MLKLLRMFRLVGLVGLVLAVAVLGACTIKPSVNHDVNHESKIYQPVQTIERSGKFGASVSVIGGKVVQSAQGGFTWLDNGKEQVMDILSPVGSILARLTITPEQTTLQQANGQIIRQPSPDALIESIMKVSMPVSNMINWIKGAVNPSLAQKIERDSHGRAVSFTQAGWNVRLNKYDALGPTDLVFVRFMNDQEVRVKIFITSDTSD